MSKRTLSKLETLIGIALLVVGTFVAFTTESISVFWIVGISLCLVGSYLISLNALRRENDTD